MPEDGERLATRRQEHSRAAAPFAQDMPAARKYEDPVPEGWLMGKSIEEALF